MSMSLFLGIAAGYLAASPQARAEVISIARRLAGEGIDLLNKAGGIPQGEDDVPPEAE